jgi:N12 class adenine-specific DNA methylase
MARFEANLAALKTLKALEAAKRHATPAEQALLARWSGWGALPAVFDERSAAHDRFFVARQQLRGLLTEQEFAAAQRSTINAHYTDAAYAQAIWAAVQALGFAGGRVLEPGCGSGNFLGAAPEQARCLGVELEPLTASIAQHLYPTAEIRSESFAESRLHEASFDLVLGNVPFGAITLHDPRHNAGGHAIHNHFIIKSLHLTRPGGLVAVLTSRYTLDATNPAARREMATLADLVGAVRLPSGAHRRAAGTEVVTDLLLLRRRASADAPRGFAFERSLPAGIDGAPELRVNEYFLDNPDHVLGRLCSDHADLGRIELSVRGDLAAGAALRNALTSIVERARGANLLMQPSRAAAAPEAIALVGERSTRPDGYLIAHHDGSFTRQEDGQQVRYEPPASQAAELRSLLQLRDTVVDLLESEAQSVDDTEQIAELRQRANKQYDGYLATYGPINRFSWRRTGRADPDTGEDKFARISPQQGGFRADPYANVVYALEHFDPNTQTARKATIFHERVVARRAPRLGSDDPADALAICLDTYGEARLDEIARLLGTDQDDARRKLGTLVFDEPGTQRLVPAAEYLSGNVRAKLAAVEAAADPRFDPNASALRAALPRDLRPDEIDARLGAAWIAPRYVQQFLAETLQDDTIQIEHEISNMWVVRSQRAHSVLATSRWGTGHFSAVDLAEALLEQRPIRVYDVDPEGRRTLNPTATVAASEKATELAARFSEWVWEQPERAKALTRVYNDTFNSLVPRQYDGVTLTLPGLARNFQPRPHQISAVARIIHEPATGLFHEVGAGKTAEMVMGAMELRRLGLIHKPVVVVPNHMLEQFSREWLQLYPQAKLLAATTNDLDRAHRRLFVAKCATGDWDGIIMTRSAFERSPMSPDVQKRYLEREVADLALALQRAREANSRFSVKRLEKMKLSAEERLKQKLDSVKDEGITFEQLGIDYIFVDEAHAYKNLRTTSNIPGMAVDGSQRASDLHMKLEYLRERRPRVGTLASATPIANSVGEAFTMQRYLRPDLLKDAGVAHFDTWAATFGETTTTVEVAPDGSGLRLQSRFAKFKNVPELLLQWRVSSDIKTAEDLHLPVPLLKARASDGLRAPEIVLVPPSTELQAYVKNLARRADLVRSRAVRPDEDNLLKISSDGRAAALDLRLIGESTDEPQKTAVAADRIARIYIENRGRLYPSDTGELHPTPGALQIVFADLGTPASDHWNAYDALREHLVDRGVPRSAIRFVHEARNDREKAELFSACREGHVAVLVGSTERMGVGTNVQRRAVALHHLDCPWRPADLAQREGRLLRQGNANEEVRILRYVTEASFDAYSWQTVTRKAQFIAQVMRGRLDVREIEDIGDAALSYNEVRALATGNPLLLEQAQAQAEVHRLERLQRAHLRNQDILDATIHETTSRLQRQQRQLTEVHQILDRPLDLSGAFRISIGSRSYDKRADANEALRLELARLMNRKGDSQPRPVGTFHGLHLTAACYPSGKAALALGGLAALEVEISPEELAKAALVTRLENRLADLPTRRTDMARMIERLATELERAREDLGTPFRQADQLHTARERLRTIDEQITSTARGPDLIPDDQVESRWNALVTEHLAGITTRAPALSKRLEQQLEHLSRRLSSHQQQKPEKPGALGVLVGAHRNYEASLQEWSEQQRSLERRSQQLAARLDRLQHYATSTAGAPWSLSAQLAHRRAARRAPELAERLAALQRARDPSRGGRGRDPSAERHRRVDRGSLER